MYADAKIDLLDQELVHLAMSYCRDEGGVVFSVLRESESFSDSPALVRSKWISRWVYVPPMLVPVTGDRCRF